MTAVDRPVAIYSDGACSGNPGPGGWAAVVIDGDEERELSGAEAHTTNQRMEIRGALEGLRSLDRPRRVGVYSDSAYVVNCFRDKWYERLTKADVCVGKVYDVEEMVADPQVLHRRMVVDIQHPTLGNVRQVGIAIKLSETPGSIRSAAPTSGQHTDAVLKDLGLGVDEISALRGKGVIG